MKRRLRIPFYVILFVGGLVFGVRLGILIAGGDPRQLFLESRNKRTPTPVISGQHSFLIIGVDRLNSPPARLQGVWYVAYVPANPEVTLIPLYPTPNQALNNRLDKTFNLEGSFRLSRDFVDELDNVYKIDWDTHILLDDFAVIEFIDLLGGVELNGVRTNGSQAVGAIPTAWSNPQQALDGQIAVLQGLCERTNHLQKPMDLTKIMTITPIHLIMQVDLEEASNAFSDLLESGPTLTCNVIDFRSN